MEKPVLSSLQDPASANTEHPENFIIQLNRPFIAERKIIFTGYIDEESAHHLITLIMLMRKESQAPIHLFINSTGGEYVSSRQLIDFLSYKSKDRAPVIGVVVSLAHSAAFDLLQACQTRIAWPCATLMLHAVDFGEYRIDDPEIKKYLKQSLREHHKVIKRVSKRSECSFDFLCYLSRQEKVLGAQEALKYGLIDRIERIYP